MADAKVGIEVEVNAKQAKTTLSNLGKTTQKNAKGMSAALGSVTKSVIGLTASFASLRTAVATVQEFSRFQRAMAEVSTLVDTTTMDMSNLTQQARSLAIEFGQAPTEQAKAFYQTISAGATDSATAIETMRVANKLAVGGVTSVENAVDGLTSVMNAYGVEQDGINDLADIFFTGMKKGKTTVGKLAFEIGRIAPIAAASGVAFDELTAAIAATTTGGIRTETAVIGLRQTLASINKPSGDAQKEAKRLGIEFNVAALKAKGLVGVLKSITSSSKFTENSMSKLFGNIRALTSVLALTGNEGKKLAETLEAMATRAGNADEATEKMTKTFGFQFDRFNAGMKATVAQMVELTGVTSVMGVAMSFWSDMMEKAQRAQTVTVEGLTDFKTGMQDAIKVIAEGTGQSTQTVFTRLRNELGLTSVQIIQRAKELTEKLKAEAREREADEQKQVRARAEAEEKAAAEATARRKKQIKEAQKRAKRMQQMLQDEIRGLEEHRIEEDKKKRERLAAFAQFQMDESTRVNEFVVQNRVNAINNIRQNEQEARDARVAAEVAAEAEIAARRLSIGQQVATEVSKAGSAAGSAFGQSMRQQEQLLERQGELRQKLADSGSELSARRRRELQKEIDLINQQVDAINPLANAIKAFYSSAIASVLDFATQAINAAAARAFAEVLAGHSAIPFVGLALGAAAASAASALVKSQLGNFSLGGQVGPGGRRQPFQVPDTGGTDRDVFPALLRRGEVVMTPEQITSGGGGGGSTIVVQAPMQFTTAPPTEAVVLRHFRDSVLPAINRLEERKITGGVFQRTVT